MKDKATMMNMLKEDVRGMLLKTMADEELESYFFYKNFNQEIKTKSTSEDFVSGIFDQFHLENNHSVPFAKMEAGYVQCIPNPHVFQGFITV